MTDQDEHRRYKTNSPGQRGRQKTNALHTVEVRLRWIFRNPNTWTVVTGIVFVVLVSLYLRPWKSDLARPLLEVFALIAGVHLTERVFLWKTLAKWHARKLHDAIQPISQVYSPAVECGIVQLYQTRENATQDVIQSVESANDRVWLLGIALHDCFNVSRSINYLMRLAADIEKRDETTSESSGVRILLQDPYRTSAIFRTLLESEGSRAKRIVQFAKASLNKDGVGLNPLLGQGIFSKLRGTIDALNSQDELRAAVRFYGHNPNCWLAIVDNVAYFEPYTFGRKKLQESDQREECLGSNMPIIKVQQQEHGGLFEILESHFKHVWETSDIGLLHMEARRVDEDDLILNVFKKEFDWLESVYKVLYRRVDKKEDLDQRRFSRRPCESLQTDVKVLCQPHQEQDAKIRDYSEFGLGLTTEAAAQTLPQAGKTVTIDFCAAQAAESARVVVEHYRDLCDNTFEVLEVIPPGKHGSRTIIRLKVARAASSPHQQAAPVSQSA
jgi:hypothetical protein